MTSPHQGRDRRRAKGRRYSVQTQSAPDKLCQHHVTGTTPTSLNVKVWERGHGFSVWLWMMRQFLQSLLPEFCGVVCVLPRAIYKDFELHVGMMDVFSQVNNSS